MENLKDKIKTTADILARIAEIPQEKPPAALGIDLDGTIDEAPDFFKFLAKSWEGPVYVITYRDDHEGVVRDLERFGVEVDGVVCVDTFAQKAQYIEKLNVTVYFDDMDEVLLHIPPGVTVFKIRNEGNFDYDKKHWLYSKHTGRELN